MAKAPPPTEAPDVGTTPLGQRRPRASLTTQTPGWLDRIMARTTEEGDCLIWEGVWNNGSPQVYLDGKYQMVRRVLWQAEHGPIRRGLHPRCTCGEQRCVRLAHIRLRTTRQIAQDAAKTGSWSSLLRRAKIAAARRKASKLTQDDVARIRAAETGAAIARELGISKSMAAKIRSGAAWAPIGAGRIGWLG